MQIIAIIPNIRFLNRIFGLVFRLFKNYYFYNKKIADFCDNFEYSVSKPNIRPSIPFTQKLFFFLRKNMPIIAIIPNIRRSIPIIQKLLFFLRKNMPIIAIIPNIRRSIPIIQKLFFF